MRFFIVCLAFVAVASACSDGRCGNDNTAINDNTVRIKNDVGKNSRNSNNMVMNNVDTDMVNNVGNTRRPMMGGNDNTAINRATTDINNKVGMGSKGSNNMVMNNVDTDMTNKVGNRGRGCLSGC